MNDIDKIKGRIKALLSRTVDRGASENEAKIALEKATKLMTEYQITQHDLKTYSDDKIEEKTIEISRQSVYMRGLLASICACFDCESYYTSGTKKVTIFGYKTDIDMTEYISSVAFTALENEINKYKRSEDFECLIMYHAPRTVINGFINGFCYRISQKIKELVAKKTQEIETTTGTSLICLKNQMIKKSFEARHPNLGHSNYTPAPSLKSAFEAGVESARNTSINRGIGQKNTVQTKLLK